MTGAVGRRPEVWAQLLPSGAVALSGDDAHRVARMLASDAVRPGGRGRWCVPPGSAPDVSAYCQAWHLLLVWRRAASRDADTAGDAQ